MVTSNMNQDMHRIVGGLGLDPTYVVDVSVAIDARCKVVTVIFRVPRGSPNPSWLARPDLKPHDHQGERYAALLETERKYKSMQGSVTSTIDSAYTKVKARAQEEMDKVLAEANATASPGKECVLGEILGADNARNYFEDTDTYVVRPAAGYPTIQGRVRARTIADLGSLSLTETEIHHLRLKWCDVMRERAMSASDTHSWITQYITEYDRTHGFNGKKARLPVEPAEPPRSQKRIISNPRG